MCFAGPYLYGLLYRYISFGLASGVIRDNLGIGFGIASYLLFCPTRAYRSQRCVLYGLASGVSYILNLEKGKITQHLKVKSGIIILVCLMKISWCRSEL